jgi:hypothetical protein
MLEYKMIVNEDNKVIIITGNKFILRNLRDYQFRNTMIIYDNSSKFNRILRLLRNRKLNTRNIIMMYFAQIDKNSHKRINNQFTRNCRFLSTKSYYIYSLWDNFSHQLVLSKNSNA